MNKTEPAIKLGRYSGYDGPAFCKKPLISTYDTLRVDIHQKIPSPSIAEARKKMQQYIIKKTKQSKPSA